MLRLIYTLLLYVALPLMLVRLVYRAIQEQDLASIRLGERLGSLHKLPDAPRIALHAVSLGEMNSAAPLLRDLRQQYPGHGMVLTSTTPTGLAKGGKLAGENDSDKCVCVALPYDLPDAVARFLDSVKPELLLVMENEIWPNLLAACAERNIPVAIVNARLSPKSMVGYRRWRLLFAPALDKIKLLAAQDEMAASAWRELQVNNVQVAGNLKYDALPDMQQLQPQVDALRVRLGLGDRMVWIAASTHREEDAKLMVALLEIRKSYPNSLMIWVPRHPWRSQVIEAVCREENLKVAIRSDKGGAANADVFLVDTLGELQLFYALSQVAFVGGSLFAHGGHNVLEAAVARSAILCGPHTFNFSNICQDMEQQQALQRVYDSKSIALAVHKLFASEIERNKMADNAVNFISGRSGASAATCKAIASLLPPG